MVNWTVWPTSTVLVAGAKEAVSAGGIYPGAWRYDGDRRCERRSVAVPDLPGPGANVVSQCGLVRPRARWMQRRGNRNRHSKSMTRLGERQQKCPALLDGREQVIGV